MTGCSASSRSSVEREPRNTSHLKIDHGGVGSEAERFGLQFGVFTSSLLLSGGLGRGDAAALGCRLSAARRRGFLIHQPRASEQSGGFAECVNASFIRLLSYRRIGALPAAPP